MVLEQDRNCSSHDHINGTDKKIGEKGVTHLKRPGISMAVFTEYC